MVDEKEDRAAGEKPADIIPAVIEDEMKSSYIDYAMSVIIGRALPDIRDGLKPVHRRILYAMKELGVQHNKPFRKCARIVGDVLGKYHPHGDAAVYEALVRMAQDFSLRYPLVMGQGNFGSIDGDNAASMRYTEAKLSKISSEMLEDIEKGTVEFIDNFDGSLKEPTVLPSRLPNLLVNGSSGIAVGMATNIPPHNIKEICEGVIKLIDNPEIGIPELCETIIGPDFPTGGIICGRAGIMEAFAKGTGKVTVRARTKIEEEKNRKSIIVTEIPYMVNKSQLLTEIADLVKEKTIMEISDIRDESDRDGMRIVIDLKKDANDEVVLNQLFKHSRLQNTFGINMVALVDGGPKVLNLKQMLINFVRHRRTIIIRRTEFDLNKLLDKAHILEGLIIALNDIDHCIALIKASKSVEEARNNLIKRYKLSEKQSQAILDMRLQKLTSLEQENLRVELKETKEEIKKLREILDSEILIMDIIKDETRELIKQYGDERRTGIMNVQEDIDIEDLIVDESMVVTITHSGYIKRMSLDNYKTQRRGGRGIIAVTPKEDDFIEHLFVASTHDYMLFFTDDGIVHWLKVWKIPESSRYASGKPIVNLLELDPKTKITAYIPIKSFDDKHYLLMATKKGITKKTNLEEYSRPRQGGIIAILLEEGDELINVLLTDGKKTILLATKEGMAVKFMEDDVRPTGRASYGVIGIRMKGSDELVGMIIANDEKSVLTITENGYGKRTTISEYRLINRGGSGVINIICSERNGRVARILDIETDDEIMVASQKGIMIRMPAEGISVIGRNTQGVRLMKLEEGDRVVSAAKVAKDMENGNNHDIFK